MPNMFIVPNVVASAHFTFNWQSSKYHDMGNIHRGCTPLQKQTYRETCAGQFNVRSFPLIAAVYKEGHERYVCLPKIIFIRRRVKR